MSISCPVFHDFLTAINRVDSYRNTLFFFFFDDSFLIFVGAGKCDTRNLLHEPGSLIMKMVHIEFQFILRILMTTFSSNVWVLIRE